MLRTLPFDNEEYGDIIETAKAALFDHFGIDMPAYLKMTQDEIVFMVNGVNRSTITIYKVGNGYEVIHDKYYLKPFRKIRQVYRFHHINEVYNIITYILDSLQPRTLY